MTIVHSKVDGGRNQGVDVADDNRGTTDGSQATDREPMNLSDTSGTGDLGEATAMGSLYTPTTACPHTAPPLLSNLRMILWFWASSTTMTRPHTWMRWRDLHHGARTTVSL